MKKNVASNLIIMGLLMAALAVAGGCSKGGDTAQTSSAADKPFTFKIAHNATINSLNVFWIANELGFDKEENLNFEDVGVISPGNTVASVVAGKIDVGGYHVNRTIAGIAAGAKIKAVVAGTETSKDIPHMIYVTREDSPIKTYQDLFKKKVGLVSFGGCMEGTPYGWLKKNGISEPKGKFEIVVLPTENKLVQALRDGQVDAIGLHKDPSWLDQEKGFKVLFTDYDVWDTVGGATPFYLSEAFIAKHPEEVKRFVKVVAKTNKWIDENRQQAREITAKRGNVDVAEIGALYYVPDGVIKEDSIQLWIDILTQFGEIKPGVKPSDIYTNEFNANAKK